MKLLGRVLGCVVGVGLLGGVAQADTPVTFLSNINVGQPATPLTVLLTMAHGGVAVAPSVVTQGVAGMDFGMAAGGTCAAGVTYNAGDQCTVVVTFQPKYPGPRNGAVMVLATDGTLLSQRLLAGNGWGGLETLQPGRIDTVAGDGAWIYTGDNVAATSAPIFLPMGIVADAGGNLWIADSNNYRIRRVNGQTGVITTVAGNGTPGFAGDGGPATQAEISGPSSMLLDGAGDLYFVDNGNHAVRRIDAVSGIITTVAGTLGVQGYSGDLGPATRARLSLPEGLALDTEQNLYIGDTGNNVVRVVSLATGIIRTKAGTSVPGYNGDGGLATAAQLNAPWGLAVAADKSLYVAESSGHRVRRITTGGTISTVAGTGIKSFGGDGAAATLAGLDTPVALAFDPAGNLYIADSGNNRVRKMIGQTGNIVTIAGNNSEQFAGDAGPANQASLYGPYALFLDQAGNLLVADMFHNRVRRISANSLALVYPTQRVGKLSAQPQVVNVENDGNANMAFVAAVLNQTALDTVSTTCAAGLSVAPESTCSLGILFAPTSVGPVVGGSVTQATDAGNSPAVISVYGEVLSVDPTALSLMSTANPSLTGAAVTFTATVTGSGSGWTGAVTFTDGTARLCSANLVPGGTATCTVSTLTLGTHTIGASYAGDTFDAASTAPPLTQIVKQAPTLVLTATPNPVVVTDNVTLTLQASATGPVPTGTVVFYDGTTAMGSAVLSGTGGATYSTVQLTPGSHALSVGYAGDTADAAGQSNVVTEVVQQAATITALASSNATVQVGTTVTLTATVTCQGGPAPTGTVQFSSGTTALGSGTVTNGTATLVLNSLAPGVQNIVASYSGDTDDATSASAPLVQTVQQIGTTTALTADANPVNALATLHLSATVAIAAGGVADGAITGQVTFKDGTKVLGQISVDVNGVATMQLSTLAQGSHALTATYAGNTNYAGSASPGLSETVTLAGTTMTIAGPATALAGTPVALSATVAGANGIATGTVTFSEGGTRLGSGTLNSGGGAAFTTSTLAVGSHSIVATYGGDANFAGSVSSALTVVIAQDPTTTAVAAGPSPAAVGQSVTMTATTTAVSQGFTGSVNFMEGNTVLGSGTINAAGMATFTTTGLALGSHTITAVYAGDVNHLGSTSPGTNELIVQMVSMLVTASANPATSGTSVVFSAKVGGSTGGPVPTGPVTFLDGTAAMGTGTLDANGVASFATSKLAVGTHTITANFGGDSNYGSGTAQMTETIQSASTQVTLLASANPATYGTPLGLTATIASTGGLPTGSVTFTEGTTTIGSGTLDASGVARLTTSTLAPGVHSIIANYGGDGKASASVSAPLAISVLQVSGVVVAANPNPAQTLAAVVLTATVTNAGASQPGGTVSFTDGGVALGNATLDATGHASITVPQMTTGNHAILASYAGDGADFPAVSAQYNEAVVLRPTAIGVSGTATDPNNPLGVTLIAAVRWTGAVSPTGTVTFSTKSGVLGTNAVNSTGVATLTVVLSSITESIVATYNGDASYATSASLATDISGGAATQFTLNVTPPNMTVVTTQHTVVNVMATSVQGFTDKLQLGCLGLPYAATCTFNVTSSTLAANGTMVATLTIDTGDPLGAGAQALNHQGASPGSGLAMCLLPGGVLAGLALFRLRRRSGWAKSLGLLAAALAVAVTMGLTGCAGLKQASTPVGTYTFKVTASGTGTGATVFQTVTMTVTQ